METESQIEGQMKNQIRHLQEDDIDAVAKIWLDTNMEAHSFVPAEYWEGNLTSVKGMFLQAEMYVYEENGEILGFIGLDQSYVAGIFVKSQYRSLGIGKALLDFVKEQNEELTLHVYQKNEKAVHFYKREGFRIQKEMQDETTGEKEYLMIWEVPVILKIPEFDELIFRKEMLLDPKTMEYNHEYGGTILFDEKSWELWYGRWILGNPKEIFYRYIYDQELQENVGEVAYHKREEKGNIVYIANVIVLYKYRGHGYGKRGLRLLCKAAKENGLPGLTDDIAAGNPSLPLFLKNGFRIKYQCPKYVRVEISL